MRKALAASEVGKCHTAIYCDFHKMPRESHGKELLELFSKGSNIHKMVQAEHREQGIQLGCEVKFQLPDYNLKGKMDEILNYDGTVKAEEMKSIETQEEYEAITEPRWGDFLQLQVGMLALGIENGENLYICMENTDLRKIFPCTLDKKAIRESLDGLTKLWEQIHTGEIPGKRYDKTLKQCEPDCLWRNHCKEMSNGRL